MAEFIEVVFGFVSGLTSYLTWANVRALTLTIALVWVLVVLNRGFDEIMPDLRNLLLKCIGNRALMPLHALRALGSCAANRKPPACRPAIR